jgi:hypothetical protein
MLSPAATKMLTTTIAETMKQVPDVWRAAQELDRELSSGVVGAVSGDEGGNEEDRF